MSIVEQMLAPYEAGTELEKTNALREVMQEIALAGLQRGGFFQKAAFYGGTCLRIFHGLPRFSEDLDFSLLHPDPQFSFTPYFNAVTKEFAALGFDVEIRQREKKVSTAIVSAFLKNNTNVYDLQVKGSRQTKIKFEVDTDPPLHFGTEERLLLQPFSFYTKCFVLPDLFAGKIHALLYRQWRTRVKGRDWFDFEWYVRNGTPLNLSHYCERARQSGDLTGPDLTPEEFTQRLQARIATLDVDAARQDIQRFVRDPAALAIWSREYFQELALKLRLTSSANNPPRSA
jgi:predicted nucleotidyltransferase component of viral defense system